MNSKPHNVVHRDTGQAVFAQKIFAEFVQFSLRRSSISFTGSFSQTLLFAHQYGVLNCLQCYRPFNRPHGLEHHLQPHQVIACRRPTSALFAALSDVGDQLARTYCRCVPLANTAPEKVECGALGTPPILNFFVAVFVLGDGVCHRISVKGVFMFQQCFAAVYPLLGQRPTSESLGLPVYNSAVTLDTNFRPEPRTFCAVALGDTPHQCSITFSAHFGGQQAFIQAFTRIFKRIGALTKLLVYGRIPFKFKDKATMRCTDDGLGLQYSFLGVQR